MIGDILSSQNTDTLSLLQQNQTSPAKADTDSLQLVDLHAVQEVDSGFEGTPYLLLSPHGRCHCVDLAGLLLSFLHSLGARKEISLPTGERLCIAP